MATPIRSPLVPAPLLRLLCIGILVGCGDDPTATPPPSPPPAAPEKAVLVLSTITTGGDPDVTGYLLVVDGVNYAQLDVTAERELPLVPGQHSLGLSDVARNCAITGENPRTFTVVAGQRLAVTFQLACPKFNTIDVVIATTGVSLDQNGYVLSRDGSVLQHVASLDHAHLADVAPGSYLFRLSSVAGNCTVAGGSSRIVTVTEDQSLTITFDVNCISRTDDTPGEKLVVSGREAGGDANLEIMNPDGSGRQRLTDDAGEEMVPEFSPDGSMILFVDWLSSPRKLVLLDRAQREESALPTEGVDRAVWSPDGTRIAFARRGRLYLMNADGSAETALTSGIDDRDQYWSPDGGQIAFSRDYDLYLVNSDGSQLRQLASYRLAGPWSPDGHRLIVTLVTPDYCHYYYYYCSTNHHPTDLAVLAVDGSAETALTESPLTPEWSPAWSRDGQRVYFIAAPTGNPDLYVISVNTLAVTNLTTSTAREEWVSVGVVGALTSALRRGGAPVHRP